MGGVNYAGTVAERHAPLTRRLRAVLSGFDRIPRVELRDCADPASTGPGVALRRAAEAAIDGDNATGRYTLSYRDPTSDTSLAALLACVTRPGAPIAADPESLAVLALADRLAKSAIPVLINGPTGTGKEVLSRFIHDRSERRDGPFVAINCAAMPETLLEAMLFGHQKGAFTGAAQASEGFFRAAHGGTLLLDEIAEMPLALQAKLLRALQEGEVVPIGATTPVRIDVRIIACANRDLPMEVAEGRFRADLFYRINVFPLALRPLRERPLDIAPLAFAMILRYASAAGTLPWLSDAALSMLAQHGWPGNVRELENVIRRALLLGDGQTEIGAEHIVFDRPARLVGDDIPAVASGRLSNIVQISEARAIMDTLDSCGGNRVAAARRLGISERTLCYRLASFRDAGLAVAGAAR